MKKKRNHLRRYNSLQDCKSGLSLFTYKGNRTLLHGKQNTAGKIRYFDEMMKVYINIKRNSNLRLHQPFNKRIGLMKRGRTYRTLHHFSFGERFDETMMNAYHFGYQYIILSPHQFIGFSSANKSIEQTDGRKCHYPQAGRTSDLLAVRPADKGRRIISMKRKGLPIPLVLSQAFGNKKAIAH